MLVTAPDGGGTEIEWRVPLLSGSVVRPGCGSAVRFPSKTLTAYAAAWVLRSIPSLTKIEDT